MALKIEVDFDRCESNAVCMQVAPKYFEVRDDDFLYILQEEVDAGDEAAAQEAVDRCPKQAISLVES
ncbi:MAG: ferredoxin [Acidimicrobiales bacterium]|nr:ferredoxin [Acidimicrobiales bacterium]